MSEQPQPTPNTEDFYPTFIQISEHSGTESYPAPWPSTPFR